LEPTSELSPFFTPFLISR